MGVRMKQIDREINIDFLRMLCIMMVLVIHTTSNYYVDSYGTKYFYLILVISSLTCAAVPLFYMLSGAFLINEKNTDYKVFYKKAFKIYFQTLFWTFIYLLIYKFYFHQDLSLVKSMFKSLFTEQVGHLWYMYPLIGLYFLCPFITKLYYAMNDKEKKVLISIVLIIPVILCTMQLKFWDIVSIPKFALLFPELGLFVLGKYLYEHQDNYQNKKVRIISILGIILGLLMIVGLAIICIKNTGISSSKPYFDANKIPVVVLISSIFILICSLKEILKKLPGKVKKIVSFIGSNTGGIYFIHMIFVQVFPDIHLLGIHFTQNTGSILNMLLGSLMYLILSLIAIWIIKKIPLLKKTV